MKRQRSSDDLGKDSGFTRSSSHRSGGFYYKSDGARKGMVSSSTGRYDRDRDWDRVVDDDSRESSRGVRKRSSDYDLDGFDRRRGFDRYQDIGGGDSSGRGSMIHRSESFCGGFSRRGEFPKGFRSERDRSRREGSVSSWRRFNELEDSGRKGSGSVREIKGSGFKEVRSPTWSRESRDSRSLKDRRSLEKVRGKEDNEKSSPAWSRDSRSPKDRRSWDKGREKEESEKSTPTWSRDSRDSRSSKEGKSWEKGKEKEDKEKSSPTWSKDSGSERSKSVEVELSKGVEMAKRNEELQVESKGGSSGSEMEEGELEPDHANEAEIKGEVEGNPDSESAKGAGSDVRLEQWNKGGESEEKGHDENLGGAQGENEVSKEEDKVLSKGRISEINDMSKDYNELPEYDHNSELVNRMSSSRHESGSLDCAVGVEGQSLLKDHENEVETAQNNVGDKLLPLEEVHKEGKNVDLEVQIECGVVARWSTEIVQGNAAPAVNLESETERSTQNIKDKGKSVAVASDDNNDTATDKWTAKESKDELAFVTHEMEGPSTRGFELFTSSPVRKQEKSETDADRGKEMKLNFEPLDLSLSLPNVLLPIGVQERKQSPDSPSKSRTVHSLTHTFQSDSDAFTASVSFSGSQSFFHNPSCSLTQNSLDNLEESVKSRPIFKGVDWQALAQDECPKETPFTRMIMMNGNGSTHQQKGGSQHQSRVFQGNSSGQALQGQHTMPPDGSLKVPNGLERQLSTHKQSRHLDDVRSPSHSVGSREIMANCGLDRVRNENIDRLHRSYSQKEQERPLKGGADNVEKILGAIISEPVHVMARNFNKMTAPFTSSLKESIREMMLNSDKHGQLSTFQMLLQNRSDTSLEMLLKCHRVHLEILVALKTGLPDFLQLNSSISSSDLAEIYLNLRCRNLNCHSLLPVDECDCKVCARKNGFCSACMCLVCSKFDMASNTCSWVGCDICLHWCHANCALQASYIRNGPSATGPPGSTEVQFHCVACDHPSEMFGFVKEVFQNFAKEWTVETFRRELEYVKRIFNASRDARGIKLHKLSDQMLAVANKSTLPSVYSHIMSFLADENPSPSANETEKASNATSGPSHELSWLQSVYNGKALQLENKADIRPGCSYDPLLKQHLEPDLQRSAQKDPLFDELESIVKIKEAEAKMFQARADDARREAEGLKRIADVKSEKIEEEYTSRIAKLRLAEAEQMRKQKLEELQALEKAHLDYFNMKMRMESDIRDLLVKMEATKRNLAV